MSAPIQKEFREAENFQDPEISESYYAVIPLKVLYCKALPYGARLLYGAIVGLTQRQGYCFATNAHFAQRLQSGPEPVTERSIRRWLEALKAEGFIHVEVSDDGSKFSRKIYLYENDAKRPQSEAKRSPPPGHPCPPPRKSMSYPPETNVLHRNKEEKYKYKKETLSKESAKKACVEGHGKHVRLRSSDYLELTQKHGKEKIDDLIETMNDHISATGKKYKDYAAALRNWIKRDFQRAPPRKAEDPIPAHLKRHTNLGAHTKNLPADADFSKYYEENP